MKRTVLQEVIEKLQEDVRNNICGQDLYAMVDGKLVKVRRISERTLEALYYHPAIHVDTQKSGGSHLHVTHYYAKEIKKPVDVNRVI